MDVIIRRLTTPAELDAVSSVEEVLWGPTDRTPRPLLTVFVHGGGHVLGAWHQERLVGVQIAFPALDADRTLYLHSHITGVLPEFQGLGIGLQLKKRQRVFAQQYGFPYIGWTFDPLSPRHVWFNLGVLRASIVALWPNFYGEWGASARPTHRAWVRWEFSGTTREPTGSPRLLAVESATFEQLVDWWQDGYRIQGAVRENGVVSYVWYPKESGHAD